MTSSAHRPRVRPTASPEHGLDFFVDYEPPPADFLSDVLAGLAATPKYLAPKYFYDAEGSRLFDEICRTDEYYVTRTELALLDEIGPRLAEAVGPGAMVIEYGSGSAWKSRRLLDLLEAPEGYVAIDISRDHLIAATAEIAADYPRLAVGAICADFMSPIPLPEQLRGLGRRRLGFFPGSTIGNFTPEQAETFLVRVRGLLGPGGAFLVGVDLRKDTAILNRAYNDAAGHTAAFNLNLLRRMQGELGAELAPEDFGHLAFFNEEEGRIEMHLEALRDTEIRLAGERFTFVRGETIHTENSYKYTGPEFTALARRAGYETAESSADGKGLFSLHLLNIPADGHT
ncbi:MAG: L-histidine N(alpha)-methyltransferase [Alphaproteobacteria bacterium]